jgi:hypothetical protein
MADMPKIAGTMQPERLGVANELSALNEVATDRGDEKWQYS